MNLPKPATIEVLANTVRGNAVDADYSTRFVDAYNTEVQEWINGVKEDRVDGPNALLPDGLQSGNPDPPA